MQRNKQFSLWNARSGLVLPLAGIVAITLGLGGCSKSADTSPPTEEPAPKAAAPAAPAPQPTVSPATPRATAAPAAAPRAATPAAGNGATAAATKRLIEQKIHQAHPANMTPAAAQPNNPPRPANVPSAPAASEAPRPAGKVRQAYAGKTPILDGEKLDMTPPPADQPQPKLVYDKEVCVAEPTWRGHPARFEFNVRNEGQGVLNIKMKSCCGLSINGVRSGWPGWSLKPGESEKFEMTLSPTAPGDFTRFSPLHTNDPKNPEVRLTCKGHVLIAFKMDPRVVNLGMVEPDSGPITRTITITRGDGGPLQPKLIPPRDPRVKAELHEVEPGERYTLDVTVTPPLPRPEYRSSVILETGIAQAPREAILIVTEAGARPAGTQPQGH